DLFSSFDLGPKGGITVFMSNGSVLSRYPYTSAQAAGATTMVQGLDRFLAGPNGSFIGGAAVDGAETLHVYRRLESFPLIVAKSQARDEILGDWHSDALRLACATLMFMGACVYLALLAERRMMAQQQAATRAEQAERELRTIVDSLPVLVAYWD